MSTKDIRKIEHGNRITVVDETTGLSGEGETYPDALVSLIEQLRASEKLRQQLGDIDELAEQAAAIEQVASEIDELQDTAKLVQQVREMESTTAFIRLASETQDRFEAEGVDKDTVDEAIEWARSE
jgi:methyl-accepting chemotaxis protein